MKRYRDNSDNVGWGCVLIGAPLAILFVWFMVADYDHKEKTRQTGDVIVIDKHIEESCDDDGDCTRKGYFEDANGQKWAVTPESYDAVNGRSRVTATVTQSLLGENIIESIQAVKPED